MLDVLTDSCLRLTYVSVETKIHISVFAVTFHGVVYLSVFKCIHLYLILGVFFVCFFNQQGHLMGRYF